MSFAGEYAKLRKKRLEEEEEKKSEKKTSPTKSTSKSSEKKSSFADEYNALRNERLVGKDGTIVQPAFSLTGFKKSPLTKEKTVSEQTKVDSKWRDKNALDDGYDFGDVTKTILGSLFKDPSKELEDTVAKNESLIAENTRILGSTKMDGTDHSVLEEMQAIAGMKSGKEKKARKAAVLSKMEELGIPATEYGLYSEEGNFTMDTFKRWVGQSAMSGLASANKGLTATADLILGKPLQEMGWERNPISALAEHYSDTYDTFSYNANLNRKKLWGDSGGASFAQSAIEGTMGAVPNAIYALMTQGASVGATSASLTTTAAYETGTLLTKAGLTASAMLKNPQFWLSFGRELGTDYEEAKKMGASDTVAALGATVTSLINSGIEIGPDGMSGIQGLPQEIANEGGSKLLKWMISSAEEGGEEGLQKFVNESVTKLLYDHEADILDPKEYAQEMGIGALSGMALGGGQVAAQVGTNSAINAYNEVHLTQNEAAVINKLLDEGIAELEENGTKVTASKKAELKKELRKQMEKGYIDIADIERVLGGEEYKTHTETLAKEKSMQEEYDKLFNTKYSDKSDADIARQAELKKQLDDLKNNFNRNQMGENVRNMVKGDRLVESYNEAARRYQAFEVDPDKYKGMKHEEAARKSVESAVALGVNNTNRMHDLVDYGAKIAGDTGMTVTYTTNEKSKATFIANQTKQIAAIENIPEAQRTAEQTELLAEMKDILAKVESGKIVVDGNFVNGGIELNLDSKKPLNKLVGHELTHSFEGNEESYKALHDTLMSYAKSKKVDTDKLLLTYKAMYTGVKDADPEAEMIADMVGEYLFTDSDFVKSLSVQNRNVFQKLWDEIKYLCKVAAAGSKEARELEKVKKAFEEAYRAEKNTAEDGGVKHSISRTQSMSWAEQINGALYDGRNIRRNDTLVVCNTADTSVANEIDSKPLAIPQSVLTKAGSGKDISHSIKRGKLAKLDEGIKNAPITIVNPDRNAVVYVTNIKQGGLPIIAAFDMNSTFDGDDVHKATSIHLQVDLQAMLESLSENATIYAQKNELDSVGATNNLRGLAAKIKFIESRVAQKQPGVKWSLSDSDGRQLTKGQQEYFKDSKVRDENGNLKVMYHGTPNGDFTIFKDGTYFTDNKAYADRYQSPSASSISSGKVATNPKTFEVYLDIKKPFDITDAEARRIYIEEYIKGGNALGINPYLSDAEYDKISTIDWTEGEDLRDFLIENGYDYDGLVLDEGADGGYGDDVQYRGKSYVVFSPEQVKDINNTKPTSNPDIRYSLSKDIGGNPVKSYAEIVDEQQELYQRENRLRERKREAENNPELLQAMDDYSNLVSEMKELLPKRRNGTATQAELDRIEEIKSLKGEYLKRVADIQENIGLNAIAAEEKEIRETSRRLRDSADEAWAREGAEKENIAIEKAGVSAPEYFRKKALKAFKTTTNFNEAGYLLPDGKMLNFSGGERNHRYRDHREIGEIYEATQGTAALNRFLNDGNIRIMAESPGIDLASGVEPTKEQYAALRRFINSNGVVEGQFFVDFSGTDGRRVGNYSYEGRVNADRVLNDIKYFYANGEVREQSDIGRFLSLSAEGEVPVRRRRSDIYGEDVKLRTAPDDVAPVADAENATTTPVPEMETTTEATSVAPVTVAENATVAEMETVAPDGYGARVEEIVEALSGLKRGQRKKFGGYSAGVYTRNGSDNITLSITMPDGTIVKDTIEGGKYWSNTQLAHEIASRIAESEGYAPVDESAPVEDIAPVAPVKEKAEAIRPKPQKEPSMARATPEEQARAQILTEEPEVPKQKGKNWQKLKREALDPGTVFETLALKNGNRELQARYSSIKRADKMAQRFMAKGDGSLDSIRKTVEQSGKTKQFSEYMYHMLNTDRMTLAERYDDVENKPVFGYDVTAEMSKGIAAELEKANPEFKKWAQDVYSYMNTLREMMVENGVISAETAQLWQEQYPHYVPIRRAGKDGMAVNVPLDTGRTGINAPIKKATGGNSDILPMFDTMGQRTIQTFKAVAKNRFGVELMHTLGKPVETEAAGLDEIIDSMDTHEELIKKGENGKSPTFTVFENGERVTFDITEEMYEAMQPAQGVSAFNSKALNKLNNIRRGLITEYNLMFTATNAIKDAQDVMINSQHPVKTYAAFPQAFKELLTGKGTYVTEYLDNGGEDLTYFDDQTKTFTGDKSTLRKVVGFPLDKISDLNNFIEKIPRLAEYIASRKDGRSIDVSMLDAARVTTDFSAGGHFVKMMNRNGFTFLNASVQGAVQQVRNIREAKYNGLKGWAQLAGKVVAAGLPAMLLNHLLWDDDEEYAELSDYVKQNYYIVGKFDDGKFVRIPKGRTMAVIQSAFQQMENLVTGNDEVDLAAFGQLVVNNLAPSNPLDNNLIAPIAQAIGNRTWYGEDLVPTRLQDLPSREQHDESTDSLSKWLGEKTGLSPYKINYVLDQYSGFVGDTLLPMLTPEAENGKDTFAGNMVAPWVDKFTTDSVFNNQNVSDFYDKKDELTITANGMNATDDDILASKYMNSINAELGKLYGAKRSIQNNLIPEGAEYDYLRKKYYPGMTMAEIAKAEKNGTLPEIEISDSEKYEIVRGIQSQIVELTKQSLDTYDDISYEEPHRGYDDDIAVIGGKYFTQNDDGEWSKMSDDAVLKYQITSTAGDSNYATDGVTSYYWYEPGEDSTAEAGWRKVTDEQLEKQREVTKALGITPEKYWSKKEEYDFAYKYPENYAVSKAVGGYDAYRKYSGELYDIKADKDKNGKSISGSRKEKVLDYINGLDIDYYEKLILFKSEYTADDTYNYEIIEYLNGREDISYQDMVTILRKLGFTVDSRGNVTW